jgi:hypothetical protein
MEKNFIFLIIVYLLYKINTNNYNIKEKKYISFNNKNIVQNTIEVFKINKDTLNILKKMLFNIHNIFMNQKIIYYLSDDNLLSYLKNKKINSFKEYINLYVIEETFDYKKINKIINKTEFKIIKYFGFYKIISKNINIMERYSICINIFEMEKIKDKIKFSSNINPIYLKIFQIENKNEHEFDDVFPIQKNMISNITVCIPNNPEKILYQIYGENYKNKIKLNNNFSPMSFIYTKLTGIRDTTININ